jgi:hypothetical protein
MNNPLQSGQIPQSAFVTPNAEPVTVQPLGSNLQLQVLAPSALSLAPSNQYPATIVQYAAPARRARHGKIARLPCPERDMANRMLRDNIPYSKIVGALDDLGIEVTERNVSNWKTRGGYHDWRVEQDRAVDARLLQDNLTEYLRRNDATELPEVGSDGSAIDDSALPVSGRIMEAESSSQTGTAALSP